MTQPRCEMIFEQSIKSEHTRVNYLRCMKKFKRFVGVESLNELLYSDQKAIQEKVEDYVIFLKNKINPNSFGAQLAPVFLFYSLNDVTLNKVKIKKMFPARIKVQGFNAYTREDVRMMLDNTTKKRGRAMVLIFASTGCRVGGLIDLTMKDISDIPNSECKCIRFYTGFPEEYYSFLTPEATNFLYEYLQERIDNGEKFTDDTPIISSYGRYNIKYTKHITKSMPMTRLAISHALEHMLKKQKRSRDVGGRFSIPTTHGFRKYFNRTLKMREGCNLSICEKLMGHSVTISLDNSYLPLNREELFAEFEKAIPDLTIREDERQLLRINQLEKDRRSEEDKEKENKLLKEEMEILKLRIQRMELSKEQ